MQNKKPMVLVLAGPNGSGKSTITTFFEKIGQYTNADDVVMSTGMEIVSLFVAKGMLAPEINDMVNRILVYRNFVNKAKIDFQI